MIWGRLGTTSHSLPHPTHLYSVGLTDSRSSLWSEWWNRQVYSQVHKGQRTTHPSINSEPEEEAHPISASTPYPSSPEWTPSWFWHPISTIRSPSSTAAKIRSLKFTPGWEAEASTDLSPSPRVSGCGTRCHKRLASSALVSRSCLLRQGNVGP